MSHETPIKKRYLEDFESGDTATSSEARTISEHDHYTICNLYGTYSDLHMNKPLMKTSESGGRLVPGVGLGVIMMGLQKRVPWDPEVRALYGFDNVRFTNPVFIGDTVYLETEVLDTEKRDSDTGLLRQEERLYKTEDGKKNEGELVAKREIIQVCARKPD